MIDLKIILIGQRYDQILVFPLLCSLSICWVFIIYHSTNFSTLHVRLLQDGADIGYGAKAQEVLGQVKGRYIFS